MFWEWSQPVPVSPVCPVCVSSVLSSPGPAPLSPPPSFLAAKYFDQCDYTTKKSLDLLFAPAVGLATAVWLFWLRHDALIVLQERGVAMKILWKIVSTRPPQIFKLQISDRLAGARCSQTIQTTLSMTRGVIWLSTLWFTELITSSLQLLTCQFWKTLAKAIWRALSRSCGTLKNKKLKKC